MRLTPAEITQQERAERDRHSDAATISAIQLKIDFCKKHIEKIEIAAKSLIFSPKSQKIAKIRSRETSEMNVERIINSDDGVR